jgi:MraZ protein
LFLDGCRRDLHHGGKKWRKVAFDALERGQGQTSVFRGRFDHAIDGKGRVSLPARFREAMAKMREEMLVATTSDDPCLRAYPLQAWLDFEANLAQKPSLDPRLRQLMRHYVGHACETPVDGMGRILIAPSLREYAALQRDVVFVGQVSFVEIWSKERWDKSVGSGLKLTPGDMQALADLGI